MRVLLTKRSDGSVIDITDYTPTYTWSGSSSQVSRSLEITVVYAPLDQNISDPVIQLGDRLKLIDDANRVLIDAMVYTRERTGQQGTITYSSYDNLNRLLKSTWTNSFKDTTPEKIAETVCNNMQITKGDIAITGVNISKMLVSDKNYYDIIMQAYTKAYLSNGKKYMVIMYGEKLYVIEKGIVVDNFILSDKLNITGSSYSESLDEMVNNVRIYNSDGVEIGVVNNTDLIDAYGIFQNTYTQEEGVDYNEAAKNLLTGIHKTASVEASGNTNCISGYGVKIKDDITGLIGLFWISSDTHTWDNGVHTMSLNLEFKNIMDTEGE